jgi:MFS family permease
MRPSCRVVQGVFVHRDFRLLLYGQAASTIGDRIVFVALALYVTDLGSPSDVGIVLAAHALPLVAFVLLGGVWADRLPRHRLMLATDVVRAVLHGGLAALIFLGTPPIWSIALIEIGFGTAEAFFRPAYTGLVPQTVPEAELRDANAAASFVRNVSELLGPALATGLVLGLGAGWAFAADAGTFVVSALLLAAMRPRARGAPPARSRLRHELRDGWREVRSRQWVWVTIGAFTLTLLVAWAPYLTLGASVADDVYGSAGVYGALSTTLGAGTLVGSVAALRWRPRHPLRWAFLAVLPWPAAIGAFALGLSLWPLVPMFAVAGFGVTLFDVAWETALAQRIPLHALSRVSAFDWMGSLALMPLGFLLAGPLAEAVGDVDLLLGGAVLALLVQLAALATPGVWRLERLQSPKSPRPSSGVEA